MLFVSEILIIIVGVPYIVRDPTIILISHILVVSAYGYHRTKTKSKKFRYVSAPLYYDPHPKGG